MQCCRALQRLSYSGGGGGCGGGGGGCGPLRLSIVSLKVLTEKMWKVQKHSRKTDRN